MTGATLEKRSPGWNFAWLFDWRSDLLCFFFPLFFSVVMVYYALYGTFLATAAGIVVANCFPLVGSLHGAATWFHYTYPVNQAYYFGTRRRVLIFGVAPIVITVLCAICYLINLKQAVYFVYMIWTIQHLTQQNVGILLLYHNPGEAVVPRGIEARSQQIPAIIFGGLFFLHMVVTGARFNIFGFGGIFAVAVICLHYIWCLAGQAKKGGTVNVPAFLFWLLSAWFYLPMLFVDVYYQGMLLPLFVHWCQYVGLNCILVGRKRQDLPLSEREKDKQTVPAFWLFCGMLTVVFTTTIYFSNMAPTVELKEILAGVVMAGSLVHYFQDAFVWRFRDPFQRQTILPYIKRRPA